MSTSIEQQLHKGNQGLEWRLNSLILFSSFSVLVCWHFHSLCVYVLLTQLIGLGSYIHYEYQWLPIQSRLERELALQHEMERRKRDTSNDIEE